MPKKTLKMGKESKEERMLVFSVSGLSKKELEKMVKEIKTETNIQIKKVSCSKKIKTNH